MKPGLLTNIVTGLFIVSALGTVALASWYLLSMRQLHRTQAAFIGVNHNKAVTRALLADVMEYRKRNPAIDPVLQSARVLGPTLNTNSPASR